MMKFLKPVTEDLFPTTALRHAKYAEMIRRLQKLRDGDWLPIEFASYAHAHLNRDKIIQAFRQGVGRRPIRLESRVREEVAYFRVKGKDGLK